MYTFPRMNLTEFNELWQNPKNDTDTRGITYLVTDTFPATAIESTFSLLPLDSYLMPWATLNNHPPRCSNKKFFFPTSAGNISIAGHKSIAGNHLTFGLCH